MLTYEVLHNYQVHVLIEWGGRCGISELSIIQSPTGSKATCFSKAKAYNSYNTCIVPQAATASTAVLLCHRQSARTAYRPYSLRPRSLTCDQTAMRSHGLPFNGLHPVIHAITWLRPRPRRDGRLSWPGWLIHSGHFTHEVVTCQPYIRCRSGKHLTFIVGFTQKCFLICCFFCFFSQFFPYCRSILMYF